MNLFNNYLLTLAPALNARAIGRELKSPNALIKHLANLNDPAKGAQIKRPENIVRVIAALCKYHNGQALRMGDGWNVWASLNDPTRVKIWRDGEEAEIWSADDFVNKSPLSDEYQETRDGDRYTVNVPGDGWQNRTTVGRPEEWALSLQGLEITVKEVSFFQVSCPSFGIVADPLKAKDAGEAKAEALERVKNKAAEATAILGNLKI